MDEERDLIDEIGRGGLLELDAEMTQQFGGVKGFVTKFMDVYHNEKTPASVKNQMMAFVVRIKSEANELRGTTDYAKMSSEELKYLHKKLCEEHGYVMPWGGGQ